MSVFVYELLLLDEVLYVSGVSDLPRYHYWWTELFYFTFIDFFADLFDLKFNLLKKKLPSLLTISMTPFDRNGSYDLFSLS